MANKWKIKKASDDGVEMYIPYSNIILKIKGRKYDNYGAIALVCYTDNMNRTFQNEQIDEKSLNILEQQVADELNPLVKQIGRKFNEIMKSKGFTYI